MAELWSATGEARARERKARRKMMKSWMNFMLEVGWLKVLVLAWRRRRLLEQRMIVKEIWDEEEEG